MSDQNLEKLIASLKSEAIDAAEKKSTEIVEAAQLEAKKIIQEAEAKKERILLNADKEAKAIIEKGESALRQAARDLNISVRMELIQLLGAVLEKEVSKSFTPDLIKTSVLKIIENIGTQIELKLPPDLEQELATYVHHQLQISNDLASITKENKYLKQLSVKKTDEGWSYQISPEVISELLQSHLIDKWAKLLNKEH